MRFLKEGDKVKITIMFRGREQSRLNWAWIYRGAWPTTSPSSASSESAPKQDGRNMLMVLSHQEEVRGLRGSRGRTRPSHEQRRNNAEVDRVAEVKPNKPAAASKQPKRRGPADNMDPDIDLQPAHASIDLVEREAPTCRR
ncbi:MAG: hypothetical protein R2722_17080 [Tessaracoccus sp.]